MKTEQLTSLPPGNPFKHDLFHMGTQLGNNCIIMHRNFSDDHCPYLIVVNTETGERIRVQLDNELPSDVLPVE